MKQVSKNNINSETGNGALHATSYTLQAFTLVELLIAIGLFSVVITIAMGGFVRALRSQRQVVALISANSNVSLVMEQMVREIRTGRDFPDEGTYPSLTFTNDQGCEVRYLSASNDIVREEQCGGGGRSGGRLTSDNVAVDGLSFRIESPRARSGLVTAGTVFEKITVGLRIDTKERFFGGGNEIKTIVSARKYFRQ